MSTYLATPPHRAVLIAENLFPAVFCTKWGWANESLATIWALSFPGAGIIAFGVRKKRSALSHILFVESGTVERCTSLAGTESLVLQGVLWVTDMPFHISFVCAFLCAHDIRWHLMPSTWDDLLDSVRVQVIEWIHLPHIGLISLKELLWLNKLLQFLDKCWPGTLLNPVQCFTVLFALSLGLQLSFS